MRTAYQFKPWARLSGDAQKVGETLEQLRERHGTLSPEAIVNAARPARSILHGYFEWNDNVAAEEHRRAQAAHLLRAIVVTRAPGISVKTPVRAFVPIRAASEDATDRSRGTYTTISEAVRVDRYRVELVKDALRDLDAYRAKYAVILDLRALSTALDRAHDELQRAVELEESKEAA